jgi:hypothetical protein
MPISSTLKQFWACYLPQFVESDGRVGVPESKCVSKIVATKPEAQVKSNIVLRVRG